MFAESWSLSTERLVLRLAASEDVPFTIRLWSDARVRVFLGGAITEEEAARRIAARIAAAELLVVSDRRNKQPIGALIVSERHEQQIELAYLFAPEHWNRGYATEAIAALLGDLGSSFAGHRLFAVTQAANTASRNLLLRLNFHEENQYTEFEELQIIYGMRL